MHVSEGGDGVEVWVYVSEGGDRVDGVGAC